MEPEIKLQKYVYTRILSGFYKAVVDLQIIKEPDTNRIIILQSPDKTHIETGQNIISTQIESD